MLEIEKPIIECIESNEDGTYGKYVVEPLERGYGITLGNAMRRILLSSLPGVATTSIKIDGVLHVFSTVQGVKEDVTELILNIKSLALTMEGEGPQTIYIDAKGPGVVTGADIFLPTEGLIDVSAEIERLNNELKKLAAEVKRGESKLANEKFVAKAPAHLVEEERNKLADYKEKYATVEARLTQLQK